MGDITCCDCGINFSVPDRWQAERRNDRRNFFCPNGHAQAYQHETEKERLEKMLSRERQRVAQWQDDAREQKERAEGAERRAAAARGQVTKLKKRATSGLCPCCNRSFVALAAHMKTQHPGFMAEEIASA